MFANALAVHPNRRVRVDALEVQRHALVAPVFGDGDHAPEPARAFVSVQRRVAGLEVGGQAHLAPKPDVTIGAKVSQTLAFVRRIGLEQP